MEDHGSKAKLRDLTASFEEAARGVASPNESRGSAANRLRSVVAQVEAATPGGAPLHAQLDHVRRWLDALEQPTDHARFGGAARVREHVALQIRLAISALEDYIGATE
jgi:hypothetical protein